MAVSPQGCNSNCNLRRCVRGLHISLGYSGGNHSASCYLPINVAWEVTDESEKFLAPSPVPEPGTMLLLASGLAAFAGLMEKFTIS